MMQNQSMTEQAMLKKIEYSRPVDFSFKNMRKLVALTSIEGARNSRVGSLPERGNRLKYLTKSIWINNNKLRSFKNLEAFVSSLLERPELLSWIDLSFNVIQSIDDCILKFTNLKIIYLHGNCISDLDELHKLRRLPLLKNLTLHGNPISNLNGYRNYVVALLPNLSNLDFVTVSNTEKSQPAPAELIRKIKEESTRRGQV